MWTCTPGPGPGPGPQGPPGECFSLCFRKILVPGGGEGPEEVEKKALKDHFIFLFWGGRSTTERKDAIVFQFGGGGGLLPTVVRERLYINCSGSLGQSAIGIEFNPHSCPRPSPQPPTPNLSTSAHPCQPTRPKANTPAQDQMV